jgi:predicted metalloprotease with PDZ domain
MTPISKIPDHSEQDPGPEIVIRVGMSQPWTHYFDVAINISGAPEGELDFVMPVWTPGSYLVREFARNVQEFSSVDAAGRNLRWEKTNKNTWRVYAGDSSEVTVKYRVYAFELSVRTSFLDDSHAYINGASVFMYLEGFLERPYRVEIDPYPGWHRISTGLDPVSGESNAFLAPDFDTLVDSPIEIGNQEILSFDFRGTPHFIAIYGDGNCDLAKLRSDINRIVEAAADVFGEIPYRHYTFIVHLLDNASGGLEHMNSSSLQVSRWCFQPEESYRKFLALVAHEYFHVWNIKRIRPKGLGPFDYTRENYTRMLWVSEGFTNYYGNHLVLRSGLISADKYLETVSKTISSYQQTPGRLIESAAEASFDAWIKFYRRDEHSPNASISYYLKGELIGLLMDLEIRHRTATVKSLDDVMRLLYARFYQQCPRGFDEGEFRAACEEVAGGSLAEIFDDYVYGTTEIDFARYLLGAGLTLVAPRREDGPPKGYLGISTKASEGKILVTSVPTATPGYDHGINVRDEIIAADGYRVDLESLNARIEEKGPGAALEITISRLGKLRVLPVVLGRKKAEYKITRIPGPTAEQKALYQSWLGTPWQPPDQSTNNDLAT